MGGRRRPQVCITSSLLNPAAAEAHTVYSKDTAADITARHECDEFYGYDTWFAGHRNGEAGLTNPDTDDIAVYKKAIEWIQEQIDSDPTYQTDDTRFWVDVVAI